MSETTKRQWLKDNTFLGLLSEQALEAIATSLQEEMTEANRRLGLEDTAPDFLYILKSGRLESYRSQPNQIAQATSLLPGSVLYLRELLLDEPAEQTVITLTNCTLWNVPRDRFLELVKQHPEINQVFSKQLAAELDQVSSQLEFEQERQTALRPYLVPKVKRGIIGSSRYAVRLRQAIRKASNMRRSEEGDRPSHVLIFGEPGLGKDNAAALIHFGSSDRRQPLVQINCDTVQTSGVELFGRAGGKPGLLEWVGNGTLVLNNVQELPEGLKDRLIRLLETGAYLPIERDPQVPALPKTCNARIILTSERVLPEIKRKSLIDHVIKVPPLRVRKADIEAQVDYYTNLLCRDRAIPKPEVDPQAIRSLQGYDFPGNVTELESMISRALIQSEGDRVLTEEIFWSDSSTNQRRFRLNLLNLYPRLRQFLNSPWWPDRINYGLTLAAFAGVVYLLMTAPQTRDSNIALNLFWAWWWPVILLVFPFLGRIWCSVCPFMIYGELVQKISLKLFPRDLMPWPRRQAERWGGWFMFGLFGLILLWEELWDLQDVAYLSGCLLLLITAGAVIFSALFERRFWCRYLCPIGGMNGLFAKLSMTELRAQQGICSATCTTYQCYKGGPKKGEGQETGGCPIYSHPAQLQENRDCVLCMTCLKACPHRSVEFNLRPPGIELWTTHKPTAHEVALLFLLFGAVFLHRLPEIEQQLTVALHLDSFAVHSLVAIAALTVPGAIALLTHQLTRWLDPTPNPRSFTTLAYGYLPLVWGGTLAHYLRLGLNEAGQVLPVTAATFGYDGSFLPIAVADPAVVSFLQAVTLIGGCWLSIFLTHRIARRSFRTLFPQHLATLLLGCLFWIVIVKA